MTPRDDIQHRLLGAPGPDSGCDGGLEVLDRYVEAEIAGLDAAACYPAVAAHLSACPDCREDHDGLVALVGADRARAGPGPASGREPSG